MGPYSEQDDPSSMLLVERPEYIRERRGGGGDGGREVNVGVEVKYRRKNSYLLHVTPYNTYSLFNSPRESNETVLIIWFYAAQH